MMEKKAVTASIEDGGRRRKLAPGPDATKACRTASPASSAGSNCAARVSSSSRQPATTETFAFIWICVWTCHWSGVE